MPVGKLRSAKRLLDLGTERRVYPNQKGKPRDMSLDMRRDPYAAKPSIDPGFNASKLNAPGKRTLGTMPPLERELLMRKVDEIVEKRRKKAGQKRYKELGTYRGDKEQEL